MTRYLTLFCTLISGFLLSQPELQLTPLAASFAQPTDIAFAGTDNQVAYIVEKGGRVQAHNLADGTTDLYLDLSDRVDTRSEGGLLGLAFHPDFPDSSYLYVNYTINGGSNERPLITQISRFTVDASGQPLVDSELIYLSIDQPAANHNAGDLAFGPDGYLYIPTGDGGRANDVFDQGQDPQTLLGKVLRIDVNGREESRPYAIPTDNPYVGSTDTLEEIWAIGLRNPWRISFDRETGDLWIADVGQNLREEVNLQPAGSAGGENYGWNCREGLSPFSLASEQFCGEDAGPFVDPVLDYPHSSDDDFNGASITGGYVYRGPATDLRGYYVFADFVRKRIFLYDPASTQAAPTAVFTDLAVNSASTFGEASDGTLYVADFTGMVYELSTAGSTATRPTVLSQPLTFFPNPASRQLRVNLPVAFGSGATATLHGISGQQIGQATAIGQTATTLDLDLPALPAGVYTVRVTDGQLLASGRLVVQ